MTKPDQSTNCPECGGQFTVEETCTDRYHACLALEYPNPAYGQVHHFTVLAYMLQHPSQLSADGWQAMVQILCEFLMDGVSPTRMRQLIQQRQKKRPKSSSVVNGTPAAQPEFNWTKTIMDVRLDDPATYCADVRAWAEAVYHNLKQKEVS